MILQALYEYYQRKAEDSESGIAPEGWEWKEIPFLVVIDREGNFLRFEDTREGEGRIRRAKRFLVPQGEKRTIGIKAFLLWDNVEYVLGANPRQRNDIVLRQESFRKRVEGLSAEHEEIQSVLNFLKNNPLDQVERANSPYWKEIIEGNVFVTFRIESSSVNCVCELLPRSMFKYEHSDGGCCLVTGDRASAARLHPALKGVRGANTTGASIISFNLPSFCSYGKEQSENAPVGPAAAFAYTTALNVLLGKDSRNKVGIGDATVVFWTQKLMPGVNFEDSFSSMFRIDKEDTDRGVAAVKSLFEAPATGRLPLDEGNRFYVLGLAPNAARISVRFWKTGTVGEFSERIRQHFIDFEIVRSSKDPEFLSLYQILCNTVLEYKMDNVPPKLAGDVVVSVLDGTPYPRTLLQQCMRRVRAERHVPRTRAAILKASINRFNRFYNKGAKEVLVALDRSNNDAGYRMGRLFAVLEKMQEEALGVETIRERFYGAASSTPVTVFPRLIKLSAHYLAKLHPGRKVNLEREMQEVLSEVQKFPAQFTLDAQAMFAIGYYHQRQDFFTKKDTDNK